MHHSRSPAPQTGYAGSEVRALRLGHGIISACSTAGPCLWECTAQPNHGVFPRYEPSSPETDSGGLVPSFLGWKTGSADSVAPTLRPATLERDPRSPA